jgi:DNA polymerase III alpha subunit
LGRIELDLARKIVYSVSMRIDKYGQMILSDSDLLDCYLKDPDKVLNRVLSDTDIPFDPTLDLQTVPHIINYIDPNVSMEEFDQIKQNTWYIPDEYKNLDIAKYVLDQCKNDAELQRAGMELLLFQDRDMFPLLQYLKYLVDTMRKNNIIWGVGRGSSVSSFVLYLLKVHRINSLYYDLDINEFLK